jgi:hypothetical protein
MRKIIESSRLLSFLLPLLFFSILNPVLAQTTADRLASLSVDLWPDYDRPAMLVLLTGELPSSTTLPATVTIPLPANAELNAVARFGETGGLFSDLVYTVENGQLTFTTASPQFRVEYYAPYEVDGDLHSYLFEWTSDLVIDSLVAVVQQPLAATSITFEPEPAGSQLRNDDLTYFTFPPQTLAPCQPYTLNISYEVSSQQLSAAPATTPALVEDPAEAATVSGNALWLVVGLIAVAALIGGAYYFGRTGLRTSRQSKPRPVRPVKTSTNNSSPATPQPRFCHQCGKQAEKDDMFCRNCGTKLKT